ncbi:MAG: hypothetical protein ABR906_04555, partial [Terracidiphilus sp.]
MSQSTLLRRILHRPAATLSVLLALAAGLGLRLWMLRFYEVNGDSLIYGGLAKNLLLHGQYAITGSDGVLHSTLIRLPGYPLFLAACFRLFGLENYAWVAYTQIALELAGCLLLADFARRIAPVPLRAGAAHCTLWLAALCPFTAIYAAEPLTEALTLFMIALALWSAARFGERPGWAPALCFTFAITYAALLRPDGALLGVALAPAMVFGLRRGKEMPGIEESPNVTRAVGAVVICPALQRGVGATKNFPESRRDGAYAPRTSNSAVRLIRMAVVCVLLALAPFAAWSWRNWQLFHVFEPLAPRYANDPGQETYPGWQRWVKSWCLDYVSTYEVYWPVPGERLDLTKLPSRAFDSPQQYAETAALADDYNLRDQAKDIVPDVDARFGQLADERIAAHPWRYYLWLPLGRVADMALRPRVENMDIDLDWWVYQHHHTETRFCWEYAGLNALYLLLALAGLCLRPRF